jgi:hypothetical protein
MYLHAHSRRGTRAAHYVATGFGGSMTAAAIAVEAPWLVSAGIGISYIIAVLSHWGIERNQPLITVNPFWGAVADLKMCWFALTGRLAGELARHGVRDRLPLSHEVGEGWDEGLSRHSLPVARHRPHPDALPNAGEGNAW